MPPGSGAVEDHGQLEFLLAAHDVRLQRPVASSHRIQQIVRLTDRLTDRRPWTAEASDAIASADELSRAPEWNADAG